MRVSIIIPAYNEEKVIGECLESLSKQTFKDLEVIVVDDGSIDNSKFKIQNSKLQFKIQNLRLFEQKHKGAGAARNLGTKYAKGEILVFVDADMVFREDFIEKLVEPILKGDAIGTFSKDERLANKNNVWARCWNLNRGLPPDRMHSENYPNRQKVFRAILRHEFDKAGGFDEKAGYTDDWSLSEKLSVEATAASDAVFYHKNPQNLKDVFIQSRWMAKRRYKLGALGILVALVRVSLPISVLNSLLIAISNQQSAIFIFKLVSDFGQFIGILEYLILGKSAK